MPVHRAQPVDIELSADGMIRFYGADAEHVAMQCAQKYDRAKDAQARETWAAIADAIRGIQQNRIAVDAAE